MSGDSAVPEDQLTLSELIETRFLQCLLCKSNFLDPRLLPCLHTFCKHCIQQIQGNKTQSNTNDNDGQTKTPDPTDVQSLNMEPAGNVKNTTERNSDGNLICPTCKSMIPLNKTHMTEFPSNTFLKDLCEMYDYKHGNEKYCEYCQFDKKLILASCLCLDCNDNMCEVCTSAHHKTKLTRNHKVIPYVQVQKGLYDVDIRSYQVQKCKEHVDEELSLFCEKCDVLMCKACKVSYHDNHKWSSIDKAITKYNIQIKNLLKGIQQQIPAIHTYMQFLKNYDKSLAASREKLTCSIETQAQLLHELIDQQKCSYIVSLNDACDKEQCNIQVRSSNLQTAATSLENNKQYLQQLLQHGKPDEVLSVHQVITQRLTQLTHMQLDGITTRLKTCFDTGNLSARNITTLFGKLAINYVPIQSSDDGLTSSNALQIMSICPNVKDTPELNIQFEAAGKNDMKQVWPTGIAVTKNNDLIVVDRENKVVKIYNKNGELKQEINGQGENQLGSPFDVVVLKSGDIAVTDHESEDAKLFTTTGKHLLTIKGIKYPRGITENSKGEIIILDCQMRQLTVHDPKTGNLIKIIDGTDTKDSKVLVDPYYVTTTPQDNIIVTDTAAPNIKVFSYMGQYLANYGQYGIKNDEVLQPYGICCDVYGYIFVADNHNHRIHLLMPDTTFSKFLISKNDSLWHPMALAITQDGYLAVTEALGKVKIYKYI